MKQLSKENIERSLHVHGFINLLMGLVMGYLLLFFSSNLKIVPLSFPWVALHGQWTLYGVMLILLSYIYPHLKEEGALTPLSRLAIFSVYGWMISGFLYHLGVEWLSSLVWIFSGIFILCQILCFVSLLFQVFQGERDLATYSRVIVLPLFAAFSAIATRIVLDADMGQPFLRTLREVLDIHYGTLFFGIFFIASTALLSDKSLKIPVRLRGAIFLLYVVALFRFLPMILYLKGYPEGLILGTPFEFSAWMGNGLTLFALFRYRTAPWDSRSLIPLYAFAFFVVIFAARLQVLFYYLIPEGAPLLPWEDTPGSYKAMQFLAFSPQAWTVSSLLLGGRLNRLSISPKTERLIVFFAILLPLLNASGRLVAVFKFKPLLFPVIPLPLLLAGPLFIALFFTFTLLSIRRWTSSQRQIKV